MPTVKELKTTLDVAEVEYCKGARKAPLQELVDGLPTPGTEPEAPKPMKSEPSSNDIKIDVVLTMQDGTTHGKELAIVNHGGCIMRSDLQKPDMVFEMVKQGLIQMYGAGHIKG